MEQYKKEIYKKYHSVHIQNLSGDNSLNKFKNSFKSWDQYYGFALPENKEAVILDIGCGTGGMIYFLQEKGYINASGIDVSEEQISLGLAMGIEGLKRDDLRDFLKNKTGVYDLIIARDVMEHFARQEAFEICVLVFNALKSRGRFLIQVPNGEGLFSTSIFYGDYTHEWAYTQSSLNQLLKTVGFKAVVSKEIELFVHDPVSWFRSIIWKVIKGWHRIKKVIVTGSPRGIFSPNIICLAEKE